MCVCACRSSCTSGYAAVVSSVLCVCVCVLEIFSIILCVLVPLSVDMFTFLSPCHPLLHYFIAGLIRRQ